jgi:lipid-binding SYLF domain-containing protein
VPRWSAPSAIATAGLSWGALIGCDLTDYLIVLNTPEAVQAFSGYGQVVIGAGLEVALGPLGRAGQADIHLSDTGLAPALSYSASRGLFAGVSLDGSVILARSEVNHKFYGRPVTPMELLSGSVPSPRAAAPLYDALNEALAALPDVSHSLPSPVITSYNNHHQQQQQRRGKDHQADITAAVGFVSNTAVDQELETVTIVEL